MALTLLKACEQNVLATTMKQIIHDTENKLTWKST